MVGILSMFFETLFVKLKKKEEENILEEDVVIDNSSMPHWPVRV